jgi:hypothetical protein
MDRGWVGLQILSLMPCPEGPARRDSLRFLSAVARTACAWEPGGPPARWRTRLPVHGAVLGCRLVVLTVLVNLLLQHKRPALFTYQGTLPRGRSWWVRVPRAGRVASRLM